MDLADEVVRDGETALQSCQPMLEGRDIVGHLDDVIDGNARRLFELEEEEIRQG
jgi:hypothetical protein